MQKFYKPHLSINSNPFLCYILQGELQGVTLLGQSINRLTQDLDAFLLDLAELLLNGQFQAWAWRERQDPHHDSLLCTQPSRRC